MQQSTLIYHLSAAFTNLRGRVITLTNGKDETNSKQRDLQRLSTHATSPCLLIEAWGSENTSPGGSSPVMPQMGRPFFGYLASRRTSDFHGPIISHLKGGNGHRVTSWRSRVTLALSGSRSKDSQVKVTIRAGNFTLWTTVCIRAGRARRN